jgi:hypothetical protein
LWANLCKEAAERAATGTEAQGVLMDEYKDRRMLTLRPAQYALKVTSRIHKALQAVPDVRVVQVIKAPSMFKAKQAILARRRKLMCARENSDK